MLRYFPRLPSLIHPAGHYRLRKPIFSRCFMIAGELKLQAWHEVPASEAPGHARCALSAPRST